MIERISEFIDRASEFLAARKGLLPIMGIGCIILNFLFQVFPIGWITTSNLLLHLGVIISIIGLMLSWAL